MTCNRVRNAIAAFFFIDTATPEIYTLSLHDALPIWIARMKLLAFFVVAMVVHGPLSPLLPTADRKSTRLNSSHMSISYAVFCLKKKIKNWLQVKLWLSELLPLFTELRQQNCCAVSLI